MHQPTTNAKFAEIILKVKQIAETNCGADPSLDYAEEMDRLVLEMADREDKRKEIMALYERTKEAFRGLTSEEF